MIVNQENIAAAFIGFKNSFAGGLGAAPSHWDRVAMTVPSTTESESYGWLGDMPSIREWVGDRLIKSLSASGYTIKNLPFESSFGVPKAKFEDDQYGVFGKVFEEQGATAGKHPNVLVFNALKNGFSTACYDGQYFFDTDHPVGDNGSFSNLQEGAGDPWFLLDTTRPLRPIIFQKRKDYSFVQMSQPNDEGVFMRNEIRFGCDARVNVGYGLPQLAFASKADLTESNFNALYAAMMSQKADNGDALGITPNLLVCGPSRRAEAHAVIESMVKASGATNTNYKAVDLLITPWLA